ncbi:MAG: tRNA uridine-5-carboxymethylaminomethyl(34) synthesis GTPase MnmE, partial [Muribaculaceae bacterium]|nr:tRNA uridine-5-carboxymethylaminomethyl(34) synthesis GTPase MnmE [Muribaculaceae bacterium]
MIHPSDTICAISTPQGIGGIAVIRLSGSNAFPLAQSIWHGADLTTTKSHTAHLGMIFDPATGDELDQCVATVYHGPRSFTGEDVVEFSVHGSQWIQRELINLLIRQGARLAEAGEFTRRAFTAGKLDLAEAEAIADVIAASSRASHRIA